jgi:hypothetical protein
MLASESLTLVSKIEFAVTIRPIELVDAAAAGIQLSAFVK